MKRSITLFLFFGILLSSCSKSDSIVSVSEPEPEARFTVNNAVSAGLVMQYQTLSITNQSKNAVSYVWNLGNDCTSTSMIPSYSFLKCGGPFTITLTVTSSTGKISTYSQAYTVKCTEGSEGP